MLVGAASSAGARVRPTPQESVAALKFSTKKLVVARPRLEEVSLPLSLLSLRVNRPLLAKLKITARED